MTLLPSKKVAAVTPTFEEQGDAGAVSMLGPTLMDFTDNRKKRTEDHVSMLRRSVKTTAAFSPSSTKADQYSSSLEFEQQEGAPDDNADLCDTGSNPTSATEMDDTKKQLEELQIRTIFSLVEPLEIEIDSKTMQKKLLFITNKQARKFDFTNMSYLLQAMDITPRPQLVINLIPSLWRAEGESFPLCGCLKKNDDATKKILLSFGFHTEAGKKELEESGLNVMLFLQQCVLPVAIQTNALVLMHADECVLSTAFSQLCATQQEKMGGKLPFTPLCIFHGVALHSATDRGTVTYALQRKSKRWMEHDKKLGDAAEATYGLQHANHGAHDLPAGCTHYIIVDGVTGGKHDWGPCDLFKNAFTQRLASELPSLGIATMMYMDSSSSLRLFEDYVGRELPLLILDSRARTTAYPADLTAAATELSNLEEALEASAGTTNIQLTSMLSYLDDVLNQLKDEWSKLSKQQSTRLIQHRHSLLLRHLLSPSDSTIFDAIDTDGDEKLSKAELEQAAWIWLVLNRMNTEQEQALIQHSSSSMSGEDEGSGKETLAMEAARVLEKFHCAAEAARYKLMAERYRERAQVIAQLENTKHDLDVYVRELSTVLTYRLATSRIKEMMQQFPHALQLRQTFKGGKHWMEVATLADSCTNADVAGLKQQLSDLVVSWADDCDQKYAEGLEDGFKREELMAAYNLFLSPHLHSCNITDTRKISQMITQVAKIDRLPSQNSHEAMAIILAAWDHVDIFMGMAKWYKVVAKVVYALLLLTGMSTMIIVTITLLGEDSACNTACERLFLYATDAEVAVCKAETCETTPGYISEAITDEQSRYIVIVLSLAGSLLASTAAYLNPAQRWQQLRGAALSLESEIWKFRTRAGPYAIAGKMSIGNYSRESERRLMEFRTVLVQQVSKSAGLLDTSLHAQFELFGEPSKRELARFKHGQYKGAGTHGTFGSSNTRSGADVDDHHSPLHAPDYLRFRIKPLVDFYKGRLPRYYFSRTVAQYLLLFGTFASTFLAFLDLAAWAAVPTAVATAVTAWQEFSGTGKKLNR
jgi:hypothetical protein